jgi:hypothetical protein
MSSRLLKLILLSFYLFLFISLILLINSKPPGKNPPKKNLKGSRASQLAGVVNNPIRGDGTGHRQPTEILSQESISDADKNKTWNLTKKSRYRNVRRRPRRPNRTGATSSGRVFTDQSKLLARTVAADKFTTGSDLPLEDESSKAQPSSSDSDFDLP